MAQRGVRLCPFYQIEFNAVAAGRTIAMSKRHIRWRFGFPNIEAVERGETGTACRGVEHEITVVWSITSGKRRIMADNQEIHTSVIRSGALEHSWVMSNNHVVKIIAHSTASNQSTGRQYDLLVDGISFFNVPKVFELGLKGNVSTNIAVDRNYNSGNNAYAGHQGHNVNRSFRNTERVERGSIKAPSNSDQEAEQLRIAISQSLKESQVHVGSREPQAPGPRDQNRNSASFRPASTPTQEHDLLDLLDSDPVAPPPQQPAQNIMVPVSGPPQNQWQQSFGNPPPHPSNQQPQTQFVPQNPHMQYQQSVGAYGDTVSLPPGANVPNDDEFAPRERTYTDISSQIMQSYSGQPGAQNPSTSAQNMNGLPAQISVVQQPPGQQPQQYASGVFPNSNPRLPPRQSQSFSQPQYNNVQPQFFQNNMQQQPAQAPPVPPQNTPFTM